MVENTLILFQPFHLLVSYPPLSVFERAAKFAFKPSCHHSLLSLRGALFLGVVFNLCFVREGARVAQWWEHSPPTNVARVRMLASTPYVGWVCCWFSPLLREVFLRVLRFSSLLKNQYFQIPIRSGTHGYVSTSFYELLSAPRVNKLQFTFFFSFVKYVSRQTKKRWEGGERNKAFSPPFLFVSSKTKGRLYEKKM